MRFVAALFFACLFWVGVQKREPITAFVAGELRALTDPINTLDQASFLKELTAKTNGEKEPDRLQPFQANTDLQFWMSQLSIAGQLGSLENLTKMLHTNWPVFAEVEAIELTSRSHTNLLDGLSEWASSRPANLTHLSTFLARNPQKGNVRGIALACRKLPRFSPALLDSEFAEFYSTCSFCDNEHPVSVERNTLGRFLQCPNCKKNYGILFQDLQGRYHHANQFLTGYEPSSFVPRADPGDLTGRYQEMTTLWQAVVDHCRYETDVIGVHGQREQWQFASQTHDYANGDCEDTSILLTDWLIARGFEARVALGWAQSENPGEPVGHAWVVCRIGDEEFVLESTPHAYNPDGLSPTTGDVGQLYLPYALFDRDTIYFRRTEGWTPAYFSRRDWQPVVSPRLGAREVPPFALANIATPTAHRWIHGRLHFNDRTK